MSTQDLIFVGGPRDGERVALTDDWRWMACRTAEPGRRPWSLVPLAPLVGLIEKFKALKAALERTA
jgi:hypothetical protein